MNLKTILNSMITTLLEDYNKYNNEILLNPYLDILDLSHIKFVTPTLLLPSLAFAKNNNMKIRVHPETSYYVKKVINRNLKSKTTLSFRELPKERSETNSVVEEILELLDPNYGGTQVLWHFLNEMINNVIDHSQCQIGYTYSQKYPVAGAYDMSFYDDGISIPGSYEEAGFEYKHDCDAIHKAINGVSTKEKEGEDRRGFGMNTTAQLITRGNKGSMLIVSGQGLCYLNGKRKKYIPLSEDKSLSGTLVSIRIHENQVQNFYDYMDYKEI